jgi:hypothetical protein
MTPRLLLLCAILAAVVACDAKTTAPKTDTAATSSAEAATPPADLQAQLVDARKLAAAIESYAVDHNQYPTANSMAELQSQLVPQYTQGFPPTPFSVSSSPNGYTISAMNGYKLLSGSK